MLFEMNYNLFKASMSLSRRTLYTLSQCCTNNTKSLNTNNVTNNSNNVSNNDSIIATTSTTTNLGNQMNDGNGKQHTLFSILTKSNKIKSSLSLSLPSVNTTAKQSTQLMQTISNQMHQLLECTSSRREHMCTRHICTSAHQYRTLSKFNAAVRDPHHTASLGPTTPLNEDRAYELVLALNDTERGAVKKALDKYDALRIKQGFEGELAAHKWRSRFGRPAKIPAFNPDPTGSYCAIPVDWLKQKLAEKTPNPSSQDLWKIFMVNAVPFIGFGFLDNFTMIIAGDYIEHCFGMFMCISTMAAAGLGNTISDVLGIGSAYYVERGCEMLGLRAPDLTPVQMDMKSSRRYGNMGRICGITAGCLIGMFPLLFMENLKKKDEKEKA